jgi:hypothetical protein
LRKSIFLLFLTINYSIYSQSNSIEIGPTYGRIIKHSPAFKPNVTESSYGLTLCLTQRISSGSSFFTKFNYPSVTHKLIFNRFGDNEIFGNAIGFNSALNFYLLEKRKFNIMSSLGLGMSYLDAKYENRTNFTNNIIGSHLNLCVSLDLTSQLFLSEKIYTKLGVGILHHSNGHIKLPNLGINFMNAQIGLGYTLNKKLNKDSFKIKEANLQNKKNELSICLGLSDRGSKDDNHILPTYGIMYNRLFYTSRYNALKAGISAEYKNDDYDYGTYKFSENTDLALIMGDELFLGKVSIDFLIGVYVHSYLSSEKKKYAYQRLGISYRLLESEKYALIVGAHLKAHYGAAELTESRISFLF